MDSVGRYCLSRRRSNLQTIQKAFISADQKKQKEARQERGTGIMALTAIYTFCFKAPKHLVTFFTKSLYPLDVFLLAVTLFSSR